MATKTAYQSQADKRTKTALKLRARFDAKARKCAASLVATLTGAADAQARLDRLNLLYGVDISTETLLVHELRTAGLGATLAAALGGSTAGEEVQLFNPTANGNEGAMLNTEALFGEAMVVVPGDASAKPPKEPKHPQRPVRHHADRTKRLGRWRDAGHLGRR